MLKTPVLSRRAAFAALSVPAVSALASAAQAAPLADAGGFRDVCLLTPQSIEGPFYLDPRLVRTEIAEGRPGASIGAWYGLAVLIGVALFATVDGQIFGLVAERVPRTIVVGDPLCSLGKP